jgi:hypothetical protein
MRNLSRWLTFITILIPFSLTGCSRDLKNISSGSQERTPGVDATATIKAGIGSLNSDDIKNGEVLYFRAVDLQGNTLSYTGGPSYGGMMMGNYFTCASCHGPAAHGGKHLMMMQVMDAPPINFTALLQMAQKDAGKSSYSVDDFRKAVVQGQDINGNNLNQDMPRWEINDKDLGDLFTLLKAIP